MPIDRRSACLHQAMLCRQRADSEPARREFWTAEARKWARRAEEEVGEIVVVVDDGKRPTRRA